MLNNSSCPPPNQSSHVLTLDDEPQICKLLSRCLTPHYNVACVTDTDAAITSIAEHCPDLIFVDVHLGYRCPNGITFVWQLRENKYTGIICMLSEDRTQETILSALIAGANEYLVKSEIAENIRAEVDFLLSTGQTNIDTNDYARESGRLRSEGLSDNQEGIKMYLRIQLKKKAQATGRLFAGLITVLVLHSVTCVVQADYSPEVQLIFQEHLNYNFDFESAPVLGRVSQTTRDEAIWKLVTLLDEFVADDFLSYGVSEDYVEQSNCSIAEDEDDLENVECSIAEDIDDLLGFVDLAPNSTYDYDPDMVIAERELMLNEVEEDSFDNFKIVRDMEGLRIIESEEATTIIRKGVFRLSVSMDGHAFNLQNEMNNYGKYGNAEMNIDDADAVNIGWNIIQDLDLIPTADLDSLYFIKTQHVHFTGQAHDPGDRVVSTIVYFGRKINGIPVIGNGSTIKMEMIANGDIQSISVDWTPVTDSENMQEVVDKPEFETRFAGLLKRRFITSEIQGLDVSIERLVCGYVDAGSKYSNELLMQLGCTVQYNTGTKSSGNIELLPLGKDVVEQNGWYSVDDIEAFDSLGISDDGPTITISYTGEDQGNEEKKTLSFNFSKMTDIPLFLGLVGFFPLRRRKRRLTTLASLFAILTGTAALLFASPAAAVPGNQDYNTLMFRSYENGWEDTFTANWENYDDWRGEMNDIADCYVCKKMGSATNNLAYWLSYNYYGRYSGLNADLVAVQTHGWESGSGTSHNGWMSEYDENHNLLVDYIEPTDAEMEIALLWACDIYSRSDYDTWHTFRNVHRHGALVSAGCWDTCYLVNFSGNTTFNQVGDHIADKEDTIWTAWKNGHGIWTYDDDIIIYGLGRVGAKNCDNRARNVSFQNRSNYYKYSYSRNEPYHTDDSDKQLCGYYVTNY